MISLVKAISLKEDLGTDDISTLEKIVQIKTGFPPKVVDLNSEKVIKNNDNFIVELTLENVPSD